MILLTANRYGSIDSWLYISAKEFYHSGVDIIVYDSSDDDRTEAVVRNYQIDGLDNVKYVRWTGEWDGFSLDNKFMDACHEFAGEYDYLWLCRDGLIVLPSALPVVLKRLSACDLDMLVVNDEFRDFRNLGNRFYDNPVELFRDQCVHMATLGVVIIKNSTIEAIMREIPLEKGKNYSLYQPVAFFQYFADKHILADSVVHKNIFSYNPQSAAKSFWSKKTFLQWCGIWHELITNLPAVYDKYKKEALVVEMYDFKPFKVENLIKLKESGAITYKMVREYRDRIPLVCDTNIEVFYAIALLPKFFVKYVLQKLLIKKDEYEDIQKLYNKGE